MKKIQSFLLALLLIVGGSWPAAGLPGELDTDFSTDGYDIQDLTGEDESLQAVAVDGSGRILVAGSVNNGTGASPDMDFLVMCYNSDGSLDTSFGSNGVVTTDVTGFNYDDYAYDVAIDSSGHILVGGTSDNGSEGTFALARYNPDGSPDTSFGTNGLVTDTITNGTGAINTIRAVAIHNNGTSLDGQIVAVGHTGPGLNLNDFAVLRYRPDGTPDTNFNSPDGYITTDFFGFNYDDMAHAGVIDASDRVVAAGIHDSEGNEMFALARYTSAGTLDTSFATSGYNTYDLDGMSTYNDGAYDVLVQPDGAIVAVGYVSDGSQNDVAVLRVLTNGDYDTSFSSNGYLNTDIASAGTGDAGQAVALDANGRILVAGWNDNGSDTDFALLRYLSDGTPDPDFAGGYVTTDFTGVNDNSANALALDANGMAILAGDGYDASLDTAVARYQTSEQASGSNSPPAAPTYVSPDPFQVFAPGQPVTLQASAFVDPEGDSHTMTRWLVGRADRDIFRCSDYPESFEHESNAHLTEYTIPAEDLIPGMAYFWVVGYQDSGSFQFTMSEGPDEYDPTEPELNIFIVGQEETNLAPAVKPGITVADYRMMSSHHIPVNPLASAVIGDDLGGPYHPSQFRIGVYDNELNGGSYREYPDFDIYPGGAAWFLARNGLTVDITGVPFSTFIDVENHLMFNKDNENGWNMIGPPNDRNYLWSDVEVIIYDHEGGILFGPERIGSLPANNEYIDPRLWEWVNGQYTLVNTMVSGRGYWVNVRAPDVNLRFTLGAQATLDNPDVLLAMGVETVKQVIRQNFSPAAAIADNDADSPPQPMGSIAVGDDDDSSSVDVSCFISCMMEK